MYTPPEFGNYILAEITVKQIQRLRDEIARLRALIIMGQDYDGSLTKEANELLAKLDELTE
jgi:hypothetical protein